MRGGGKGGPVAENATGAEIYQAKCNCHGPEGKGGRAPVLTAVSSRSDSDLTTIIHDGKGKMPAFGTQLSDAQITKVVAYIKQLRVILRNGGATYSHQVAPFAPVLRIHSLACRKNTLLPAGGNA